jgi:hypothetical protein
LTAADRRAIDAVPTRCYNLKPEHDFTSRMKWNEWNLIAFGLVMGGVVGATVTGLIGTPATKLLLGNDGRLQWETLVTALAAIGAAAATIIKLNDQIRQTGKLADDQRRRRARATRAVLPLALSELANYSGVCVKQLYGLRQYFNTAGWFDYSRSDEVLSAWESPHLSENVLAVLKECIEFIDDDAAIAASELIRHLQIQQSRLRDNISRLRLNDGIHVILWSNIDQAMRDAAEIYARAMPLFVFARGQSVCDFGVKRQQVYDALSSAGCFLNYDEINLLADKWQQEFRLKELVKERPLSLLDISSVAPAP